MGITEAGTFDGFFNDKDAKRPARLMMIFFGLLTFEFGFIVNYLLGNDDFQRTSEEVYNN
jgi:hypothetical protein